MSAKLIKDWRYGISCLQDDDINLELRITFDHDYEFHLLFQQWDYNNPEAGWTYCLWFVGYHTEASLIKRWDTNDHGVPFLESATVVHEWMTMYRELQ
jgi:hypothetical protein